VSHVDAIPMSTVVAEQLALTERLFTALDGITINEPSGGWITEVVGIHVIRDEGWVEIRALGDDRRNVILQLRPSVTAGEAIAALRWWALQPLASRSRMVAVAPGLG
jgi:hypothetical protein